MVVVLGCWSAGGGQLNVNYVPEIKSHINYHSRSRLSGAHCSTLWRGEGGGGAGGICENVNSNVLMSSRRNSGDLYLNVLYAARIYIFRTQIHWITNIVLFWVLNY